MAYEDRNFEILRGQCLSIASKALLRDGVNLESNEGMTRLFHMAQELLKEAMRREFLEWGAKDYTPKKVAEKPSESPTEDVCYNSECGAKLSKKVSDYSKRHYGRPFCIPCQKLEKKK